MSGRRHCPPSAGPDRCGHSPAETGRPARLLAVLAITLNQVKAVASALTVLFAATSAISAWMIKTVAKKIAVAVIFAALAIGVWTQRSAVTQCASDAKSNALSADTTCTFFGADVSIPTRAGR